MDAKQLFVTNTLSREQIALELNQYLSGEHPARFQPDDDRLTDEVCSKFARIFGEIDYNSGEHWTDAQVADIAEATLRELGIEPDNR